MSDFTPYGIKAKLLSPAFRALYWLFPAYLSSPPFHNSTYLLFQLYCSSHHPANIALSLWTFPGSSHLFPASSTSPNPTYLLRYSAMHLPMCLYWSPYPKAFTLVEQPEYLIFNFGWFIDQQCGVSPEILLEMQNLRFHLGPMGLRSAFQQDPQMICVNI